jgi:hypothetical protein
MAAKRPVGTFDMRGADPRLVRVAGDGNLLGAYEARRGVASLFLSALRAKLLDQLRVVDARGRSDSNVATVALAVKPYGYLLYTVAPCRLFNSRSSTGPLLAGVEKVVQAGGLCGVPATARALAVNVTVVSATRSGCLNLYATAGNPPPTSVHNFAAGQVRANNAVVQVSQSGSFVALFTMSSVGKADLVVDVSGYFE